MQPGSDGTYSLRDFVAQTAERDQPGDVFELESFLLLPDRLVVVAPPHTLGELRKHYHKEVASRIIEEINKDLTGRPIDEIEAALTRIEVN